ncbi:MAG: class I SAM-dependent methyltransferase [Candidatus Kapabacteria bacterium]|nr:class I SAM-dependent methyltransferase [Ignavibacteriota bacterium]MCW5886245.1 class I SAM-dependent methyltransferase [Candidatus Kapabacteria bacterium]
MDNFWNNRYSESDFAYGKEPNEYFKSKIDSLEQGKVLLPAEGEGRNAVYAALKGWEATAFDMSKTGRQKALQLASESAVEIEYLISDASEFSTDNKYDAIGFVFSHFGKVQNNKIYPKLANMVKFGGHLIFECFSIKQIEYSDISGGPRDIEMLFTTGDILQLFPDFEIIDLAEREKNLNEGKYHVGKAIVINFFGRKK